MKTVLSVLLAMVSSALPALAATITNKGDAPVLVVVVDKGNRMEIALDAGGSESACDAGCFVTLPNGDRIALDGGETMEIVNGSVAVK